MTILEWGGQPQYYAWPSQPTFRTIKLSRLIDEAESIILPKQHLRVSLDIDISYEEANFIRETLIPEHKLREMTLIPVKLDGVEQGQNLDGLKFESVDQIVIDQINAI